jgi:hypothetical protein
LKLYFYTVAQGVSLLLGAFGALSVDNEASEPKDNRKTTAHLFSPAKNFVVHTSTAAQREQLH